MCLGGRFEFGVVACSQVRLYDSILSDVRKICFFSNYIEEMR